MPFKQNGTQRDSGGQKASPAYSRLNVALPALSTFATVVNAIAQIFCVLVIVSNKRREYQKEEQNRRIWRSLEKNRRKPHSNKNSIFELYQRG
ncbi:hypothetical protein [Kozakia baliensis]|uniref:Uncharacterized protein n=1 Tax=Kozakia baliensis TaxID=153496 RepID=A0A1D8UTH4_9PROT|nr:hypothetical protein [Kozakia baliensis]AOX16944.1 hypothetical protein A0U89_07100 [Kozakia baliensis]